MAALRRCTTGRTQLTRRSGTFADASYSGFVTTQGTFCAVQGEHRAEEDVLREELREYHTQLVATSEEVCMLEDTLYERDEAHAAEVVCLTQRLEVLEAVSAKEHGRWESEGSHMIDLLTRAQGELADMRAEVLASEAEAEILSAESYAGAREASDLKVLLQRRFQQEQAIWKHMLNLRTAASSLRSSLVTEREEMGALERRRCVVTAALDAAAKQTEAYEDWSQSVHVELQHVAAELEVDRKIAARERAALCARAVVLERQQQLPSAGYEVPAGGPCPSELGASGQSSQRQKPQEPSRQSLPADGLEEREAMNCSFGSTGFSSPPHSTPHVAADSPSRPYSALTPLMSGFRAQGIDITEESAGWPPLIQGLVGEALWCRKAPPRQGLCPCASAPSLI